MTFLIESRETSGATWQVWPLLAPFTHREDADRQAEHLTSVQPAPTRFASSVREFRVVEGEDQPPKRRMASRYLANRSATSGQFLSRRFATECEQIGNAIRAARAARLTADTEGERSMTHTDALRLAKAAWDDTSHADPREHQHGVAESDDYWGCTVGIQSFSGYHMHGHGATWREACERAALLATADTAENGRC